MKLDFDPKQNVTRLDNILIFFKRINELVNGFFEVKSIVKNWWDVLLFRLGLKQGRFVMLLRNGLKININKPEDYFGFWSTEEGQGALFNQGGSNKEIKINKSKKIINFEFMRKSISLIYDSEKQLSNTGGLIREQFLKEQYKWFEVKRKDVIDIGANIGDSAIYFALKGAKHVYAFEPYPYSWDLAVRNIKLNKLQDNITLLNEGCSGEKGSIKIDKGYTNFGNTDLKKFGKGKKIGITTLNNIIKRFNIKYPAILKIDCEGCEYGILLKAQNSDLKKFKQIEIEYHYGYLNLKRKLETAGFKVKIELPKYAFNLDAENKEMLIGLIYATKI